MKLRPERAFRRPRDGWAERSKAHRRSVRYLRAVGTRTGTSEPGRRRQPKIGEQGYFPDHTAERRAEYRRTTPGQRVAEAIEVSRTATKLAVAAARRRAR